MIDEISNLGSQPRPVLVFRSNYRLGRLLSNLFEDLVETAVEKISRV